MPVLVVYPVVKRGINGMLEMLQRAVPLSPGRGDQSLHAAGGLFFRSDRRDLTFGQQTVGLS